MPLKGNFLSRFEALILPDHLADVLIKVFRFNPDGHCSFLQDRVRPDTFGRIPAVNLNSDTMLLETLSKSAPETQPVLAKLLLKSGVKSRTTATALVEWHCNDRKRAPAARGSPTRG